MKMDRVFRQALRPDNAASLRCRESCRQRDWCCESASVGFDFLAALQRRRGQIEQHLIVERIFQAVILRHLAVATHVRRRLRLIENRRVVQALALSNARRPCGLRAGPMRPTISLTVRKPSSAMISRISWAMKRMKLTTCSGSPVKFLRSSGFCVATPTGQVSRWQTRIMMQPSVTSGAVAKPNSSAPSSAAITTSRPVFSWPSVSTAMRLRRLLSTSVWCVSAKPSSHGMPACLMLVCGDAPVPPSWPLISTTSACAFGDARGNRADADFGDQLDADARVVIGVFQIVNQLRQIFDGIDVVVRRRRDQTRRRASSGAPWRSTDRLCARAIRRLRPAWRLGPS